MIVYIFQKLLILRRCFPVTSTETNADTEGFWHTFHFAVILIFFIQKKKSSYVLNFSVH